MSTTSNQAETAREYSTMFRLECGWVIVDPSGKESTLGYANGDQAKFAVKKLNEGMRFALAATPPEESAEREAQEIVSQTRLCSLTEPRGKDEVSFLYEQIVSAIAAALSRRSSHPAMGEEDEKMLAELTRLMSLGHHSPFVVDYDPRKGGANQIVLVGSPMTIAFMSTGRAFVEEGFDPDAELLVFLFNNSERLLALARRAASPREGCVVTADIWWDDNAETGMSDPCEYEPWCDLKHGDVVGFTCAKSLPKEWYRRVDVPETDDWNLVKLTPEEADAQRSKELADTRKRQLEMDAENAARRSAPSTPSTGAHP